MAPDPAAAPQGDIPWIVSLDDHVVEPPGVWVDRLPAKYRDIGPHIVLAPQGTPILDGGGYREAPGTEGPDVAWWFYEDHQYSVKRLIAAAGYPAEEIGFDGITYDQMRPGCWQPEARLDDMAINHIEASLCFPNYPRFCGQLFIHGKDKELSRLCVEAYNDWMVDEWCAGTNGRLIPLSLVPMWDVDLAVKEVRRNAVRGVRAVCFSELPAWLGLPSIHSGYWEPLFAACSETDTVLAMHIGSGTKTITSSPDAPDAVQATNMFANSATSLIDFLFSGVLVRNPGLKLLYAEAQIGWIPYVLERVDDVWDTHRGWSNSQTNVSEPPSRYYYEQVYSCFFKDSVGIDNLDRVGRRNIMFETDYPHQDGTWPNTLQVAKELFGHLDPEDVFRIVRGNAIDLLGLELGDGTGLLPA
jgi:predicted TIM-barrel fold metal-dependent hydrolase